MAVNQEKEKSVVYFLGAGASKAVISAAPLMADLLPEALRILEQRLQKPGASGTDRLHRIKKFIDDFYQLQPGLLPRLEDILSQLDLALEENRPLSRLYDMSFLRKLREDVVYALCEVLRETLDETPERPYPSPDGQEALDLMWKFLFTLGPKDCIISLNYDIIVDNAIIRPRGSVDYGLPIRYSLKTGEQVKPYELVTPPLGPPYSFPLYKLHGSLNWVYCPVCQQLDVTEGSKGVRHIFEEGSDLVCPNCGGTYESLIIAPTLLKTYSNILLRQIWIQAEDKISKADEVVFVGYSMPDADTQLRCMLKRALYTNKVRSQAQRSSNCTIHVIGNERQPNDARPNTTHESYLQLFGEVKYEAIGFKAYIEREFKLQSTAR